MEYYYTDSNNQPQGPVTLEQLRALEAAGEVRAATMVAPVGSQQWVPLQTVIPNLTLHPASMTEPLAIWSLVLGGLGLIFCGFLAGIPAIFCGHKALSKIKQNPKLQGKGLAISGLIIGYIGTTFWLLYILLVIAIAVIEAIQKA